MMKRNAKDTARLLEHLTEQNEKIKKEDCFYLIDNKEIEKEYSNGFMKLSTEIDFLFHILRIKYEKKEADYEYYADKFSLMKNYCEKRKFMYVNYLAFEKINFLKVMKLSEREKELVDILKNIRTTSTMLHHLMLKYLQDDRDRLFG